MTWFFSQKTIKFVLSPGYQPNLGKCRWRRWRKKGREGARDDLNEDDQRLKGWEKPEKKRKDRREGPAGSEKKVAVFGDF